MTKGDTFRHTGALRVHGAGCQTTLALYTMGCTQRYSRSALCCTVNSHKGQNKPSCRSSMGADNEINKALSLRLNSQQLHRPLLQMAGGRLSAALGPTQIGLSASRNANQTITNGNCVKWGCGTAHHGCKLLSVGVDGEHGLTDSEWPRMPALQLQGRCHAKEVAGEEVYWQFELDCWVNCCCCCCSYWCCQQCRS